MVKPGVVGSGVDQIRKPHLGYAPQPLEVRMRDETKN
jgi:hypothetical protein